jgi:hypothetical protein
MSKATKTSFRAHIYRLVAQALDGDLDAIRSLGCMVLIRS